MDSLRLMDALQRVEHRHGEDWHRMEAVGAPHDPAARDREHGWARGKVFKCTTCDDQIRVMPPESMPHAE